MICHRHAASLDCKATWDRSRRYGHLAQGSRLAHGHSAPPTQALEGAREIRLGTENVDELLAVCHVELLVYMRDMRANRSFADEKMLLDERDVSAF